MRNTEEILEEKYKNNTETLLHTTVKPKSKS